MVISLLLTMAGAAHFSHLTPVSGYMVWEEIPPVQKIPMTYHPSLRFNRESTFIFASPDFIAEGKYTKQGNHYEFHPLMAFEIENSDVNKLAPDMGYPLGQKFREAYARSMANFSADFRDSDGTLQLSYPVNSIPRSFDLHYYTEGDDNLASLAVDDERALVGLWHSPEPYPEKLDARTRYKIGGLEGLQQFYREAQASDSAQFGLLDLRSDKSFRNHADLGRWSRSGSTLKLMFPDGEKDLTISANGQKLMAGGKAVFVRD